MISIGQSKSSREKCILTTIDLWNRITKDQYYVYIYVKFGNLLYKYNKSIIISNNSEQYGISIKYYIEFK